MRAKTTTVASWVAKPAISTLTPIFSALPCQLLDDAIPEPDAWTRKDKMSHTTKILVIFLAGMPKMVRESAGRTPVIKRPIVT
jgi:hypothetical protein